MQNLLNHYKNLIVLLLFACVSLSGKPYQELFKEHLEEPLSSIQGIDGIYVINLDQRPEKWHRLEPILHYNGIDASRFPAVYGMDFDIHTLRLFCAKHMTAGQLGCMLSHLSIYNHALEHGLKVIWVLEDDIEINRDPNLLTHLIDELTRIDPEWDILYTDLDWVKKDGIPILSAALPLDKEVPHNLSYYTYRKAITKEITLLRARYGTGSMVLSERGMRKLIEYFTTADIVWPYDIELHYTPGLRQYGLSNPVARNSHFSFNFSDTGSGKMRQPYEIDDAHKAYVADRSEFYLDIRQNWLDFMCDVKTNP